MINISKTICLIFLMFGITNTKDLKRKVYLRGDNATVHIDLLNTIGKDVLEISFSSHVTRKLENLIIVDLRKNTTDNAYIIRTYTGRIETIEINNSSLSFQLFNVSVMDSGHYIAYADYVVKGNTSILVARRRLLVQDGLSTILSFMCNTTQVTSIKIEMMVNTLKFDVVKYDVLHANCTEFGHFYSDRIESCALRDSTLSFIIRKVSYVDMGTYVARDDTDIPIDSILVEVEVNSAASSPKSTAIHINSTYMPNTTCLVTDNFQFEWILVSGLVVVLVATCMVIKVVGRRRERKDLKMGPISENTTKRVAADTREYEEPRSNTTDLRMYLEPIGILAVHTEDNNPSESCIKEYEKLRPDGNQVNSSYSSLGAENIQVSKRPIILFK
ncbi:hypothetical protein ACJMK2_024935 [Sinanodonta woodiana]|uniref:Uncharacterized protein n=1 Tax=Sinanodonta woodiana TaxID=1069815 RepID=A0ABD3XF07_SINWO